MFQGGGVSRDGVGWGLFEGRGRGGDALRRSFHIWAARCRTNVLQCAASLLSAARQHAGMSRPSPQLCCPAGRGRAQRNAKRARPQWRPICSAGRAPNRKLLSQAISRDLRSTHLARGPPRCPSWRPFGGVDVGKSWLEPARKLNILQFVSHSPNGCCTESTRACHRFVQNARAHRQGKGIGKTSAITTP